MTVSDICPLSRVCYLNAESSSCHRNRPHSDLTSPSDLQLLVAFSIYLFLECRAPEERCKEDASEDCLTSIVTNVDIGSRELESSPSH
ncbi:hypothetical protein PVK06_015781 [Gossypium arboreum]|uniref:Uncharacterized protein n=1 Tax=Gossypium arboreum TaxID=29729 RepID=A0ABR0PYU9_GOSAR|nr:hypothetical protein PVK06_015781 [Gossypium arboreum]